MAVALGMMKPMPQVTSHMGTMIATGCCQPLIAKANITAPPRLPITTPAVRMLSGP